MGGNVKICRKEIGYEGEIDSAGSG